MEIQSLSVDDTKRFGEQLGNLLSGGEVVELIGDIGAGKTTLVKGLAVGMGIDEDVQSPTFTISRRYDTPSKKQLAHYDFYRLSDPGIMKMEIAETLHSEDTVTVIEWGDVVSSVLPTDKLTIRLQAIADNQDDRSLHISASGEKSTKILERLHAATP